MTGLPKNLFNKIKQMIFQYTSSQRSDIAALQAAVGDYTELVKNLTNVTAIRNIGSAPIEILPAPGVGKYYEFEGVVEYTHVSADYNFGDVVGIVGETSYAGPYVISSVAPWTTDKVIQFSSKSPTYVDGTVTDTVVSAGFNLNEKIVLTTYNGNDATLGDATLKIKLLYKIVTAG